MLLLLFCLNSIMSHKAVLIIFVGMYCILCFAKQNFEMTLDRVEMSDARPAINLWYAVNKYNRTFKTLSANFTVFKYLGYGVKVKLRGYAMFGNEYRPALGGLTRNLCDLFKIEFLWVKSQVEKYSNIPTQCPILAGDYYLKDFAPNGADFPAVANFPWSKVMLHLQMFHQDSLLVTVLLYLTLDHDAQLKQEG